MLRPRHNHWRGADTPVCRVETRLDALFQQPASLPPSRDRDGAAVISADGTRALQPRRFRASEIQFTEPPATGLAIPYTLLLLFLVLLYSNLPLLFPAFAAIRPALLTAVGALGMLAIETMLSGRIFEMAWPEGGLLLAFLAATGLSCFTALWPKQAVGAVMDLAKIAAIFFVIVNCVNTERRLRWVMWAMVVGGLIPAVGALRNYAAGQLVEGRANWLGVFANPNELAYSLVILLPMGAALASGGRLWMRLAILCCSLVYLPAIFVSFS